MRVALTGYKPEPVAVNASKPTTQKPAAEELAVECKRNKRKSAANTTQPAAGKSAAGGIVARSQSCKKVKKAEERPTNGKGLLTTKNATGFKGVQKHRKKFKVVIHEQYFGTHETA